MSGSTIRIGTRASRLALWQANYVAARLAAASPDHRFELVTFQTLGDRIGDVALARIGDRGLFTRDIEAALLDGTIHMAVHSLKDLPTASGPDLVLGAVLERDDPRDALVSASGLPLGALPAGSRIGTSSLRRRVQLLALRADLTVADIRGNVPTRLEKLARGEFEGVLLAHAGLCRLGFEDRASEVFGDHAMLPAPGQGALAVQVRASDGATAALAASLDHAPTRLATMSERAVLGTLRGGCQAPLGAIARWHSGELRLTAVVGAVDGTATLRSEARGAARDAPEAVALGRQVAGDLSGQGAGDLLAAAREWLESTTTAGDTA